LVDQIQAQVPAAHHRQSLHHADSRWRPDGFRVQIPYRYNPIAGIPPLQRTGYYYLPSGWQYAALPVMVLFHGLEGFGLSILSSGSQGTYQVGCANSPSHGRGSHRSVNT